MPKSLRERHNKAAHSMPNAHRAMAAYWRTESERLSFEATEYSTSRRATRITFRPAISHFDKLRTKMEHAASACHRTLRNSR